jgi:hypothetical protein
MCSNQQVLLGNIFYDILNYFKYLVQIPVRIEKLSRTDVKQT